MNPSTLIFEIRQCGYAIYQDAESLYLLPITSNSIALVPPELETKLKEMESEVRAVLNREAELISLVSAVGTARGPTEQEISMAMEEAFLDQSTSYIQYTEYARTLFDNKGAKSLSLIGE